MFASAGKIREGDGEGLLSYGYSDTAVRFCVEDSTSGNLSLFNCSVNGGCENSQPRTTPTHTSCPRAYTAADTVALKHHTSKLPSLDQLAQVSTFGFRGEALSALCALCESVTVVTATKETAPMGAILTLGRDGRVLDDKGRVARQVGAFKRETLIPCRWPLTPTARNNNHSHWPVQAVRRSPEGV